jgi:hypothetical protein
MQDQKNEAERTSLAKFKDWGKGGHLAKHESSFQRVPSIVPLNVGVVENTC